MTAIKAKAATTAADTDAVPAIAKQDFVVAGKSWTFEMDFNLICDIEEQIGSLTEWGEKMKTSPSLRSMRQLFCFGLSMNHDGVTDTEAGTLIQAIGVPKAMRMVMAGIKAATAG